MYFVSWHFPFTIRLNKFVFLVIFGIFNHNYITCISYNYRRLSLYESTGTVEQITQSAKPASWQWWPVWGENVTGYRYIAHLYCFAVQAGFYSDVVECSHSTRENLVRSPSGKKEFFFACYIWRRHYELISKFNAGLNKNKTEIL